MAQVVHSLSCICTTHARLPVSALQLAIVFWLVLSCSMCCPFHHLFYLALHLIQHCCWPCFSSQSSSMCWMCSFVVFWLALIALYGHIQVASWIVWIISQLTMNIFMLPQLSVILEAWEWVDKALWMLLNLPLQFLSTLINILCCIPALFSLIPASLHDPLMLSWPSFSALSLCLVTVLPPDLTCTSAQIWSLDSLYGSLFYLHTVTVTLGPG